MIVKIESMGYQKIVSLLYKGIHVLENGSCLFLFSAEDGDYFAYGEGMKKLVKSRDTHWAGNSIYGRKLLLPAVEFSKAINVCLLSATSSCEAENTENLE